MPISITRRGGRVARAAAALLLAAAALAPLLQSTHAHAAEGESDTTIGVATRPAGDDGRPDGRSRFSYDVDPGQSITDQVLVGNTGTQRQDFTVYATDAYNDVSGQFALLATAQEPTRIGAWTRFENGENRIQFSLDPDEVRLLTFTIQLPAEAEPGDQVGGLVASVLEAGQQVSLDRRVATAIYARVSGELQPQLTITGFEASHHGEWWNPFGGSVEVRYTVDNPGNVALAANVVGGVDTWFGIPAAPDKGGSIPVLLPGNSASYEFEVQGVGQWLFLDAALRLNPYVDSVDPDAQLLPVASTTRDAVVWAAPWVILIALAIVGGIFALNVLRRRRDNTRALEWLEHTEKRAREEALAGVSRVPEDAVKGN